MWPVPGDVCGYSLLSLAFWIIPSLWAKSILERKGYHSNRKWLAFVPVLGLAVLFAAFLLPDQRAKSIPQPDSPFEDIQEVPGLIWDGFIGSINNYINFLFGDAGQIKGEVKPGPSTFELPVPDQDFASPQELENDWETDQQTKLQLKYPIHTILVAALILHLPLILMLLIPLITGFLLWYLDQDRLPTDIYLLFFFGTIFSTAILGYQDIRRLIYTHRDLLPGDNHLFKPPFAAFLQILGLWFPGYALHFLARRKYGGHNLFLPALVSTAAFLLPTVGAWLCQPILPTVDSAEVLASLRDQLEEHPSFKVLQVGLVNCDLEQPKQIFRDGSKEKRQGQIRIITPKAKLTVSFSVEWSDKSKNKIRVSILRVGR